LRKRFVFAAGNDGKTQLRDLAASYARVVRVFPPKEGVGNAGRPMRPGLAASEISETPHIIDEAGSLSMPARRLLSEPNPVRWAESD
jgi:hypothetical protein